MQGLKQLGPSFGAELVAAGLGGLPVSWSSDGAVTGLEALDAAQRKTFAKLYAAHDPALVSLAELKAEAHGVIVAVASTTTQLNLIAAAAAIGAVPPEERGAEEVAFLAAFAQARAWIDAVRARVGELHAKGGAAPKRQARWPEPGEAVRALAQRY